MSTVYSFEVGVIHKLRSAISKLRIFASISTVIAFSTYCLTVRIISSSGHRSRTSEICTIRSFNMRPKLPRDKYSHIHAM